MYAWPAQPRHAALLRTQPVEGARWRCFANAVHAPNVSEARAALRASALDTFESLARCYASPPVSPAARHALFEYLWAHRSEGAYAPDDPTRYTYTVYFPVRRDDDDDDGVRMPREPDEARVATV